MNFQLVLVIDMSNTMKTNDKNSPTPEVAAKPQRAKPRPGRPSLKPEAVAKRTERTLRVKIKREIMWAIKALTDNPA